MMMEIISLYFKVKLIIYSVSEDNYLTSTIINNKFDKEVELLKTGSHFDVVFEKERIEAIDISKKIIIDLIYEKFKVKYEEKIEKNVLKKLK